MAVAAEPALRTGNNLARRPVSCRSLESRRPRELPFATLVSAFDLPPAVFPSKEHRCRRSHCASGCSRSGAYWGRAGDGIARRAVAVAGFADLAGGGAGGAGGAAVYDQPAGGPVRRFGIGLGVVLLVAAVAWLWRRRPGVPWRGAWPYGLVLVVAMLAVATPMRRFGFDWLNYCNDDMANYPSRGSRAVFGGYRDDPKAKNVDGGKYYGDDFWFLHVATKGRPGSGGCWRGLRSVTGSTSTRRSCR